jgi:hypothetical protein
MHDATELTIGSELTTKWGEELEVIDVDGDEIVCEMDGKFEEIYTVEGVQNSLDDGVMTVENIANGRTESDDGSVEYEEEKIADIGPSELSDDELYIRFGAIPEGERSWDNRNDQWEDGVSVYACERDATDEDAPEDVDEAYYLAGTMLQTVFALMTRDTYLVTGEQVGTGADGEPVLKDVEAVAKLTSPKGVGGWVVKEE